MRTFALVSALALCGAAPIAGCCFANQTAPSPPPSTVAPAVAPAAPADPSAPAAPAGAVTAACDQRAQLGACTEYVAGGAYLTTLGADLARSVCQAGTGTWLDGPCPAEGRVGTCTMTEGPAGGTVIAYYAGGGRPFDAEAARAACTEGDQPGTFATQ